MNQLISDGGDCRTAPATPGLLKTEKHNCPQEFLAYMHICIYATRSPYAPCCLSNKTEKGSIWSLKIYLC